MKRNPLALVVIAFVVALMLYFGYHKARRPRTTETAYLTKASMAPDFTLQSLDGKSMRLSDLRGKAVLLNFWATWCGPCRAIAPIVAELAQDYQGRVKVGKMDVDSNSATPMRYRITGIPTLLIFKGGQVVEQLVGGNRSKDSIAQVLDKYLS